MTREEAKKKAEIMLAYAEGKEIQYSTSDNEWKDSDDLSFIYKSSCYRIKPEPHYRPFENAEEVMEAIKEHGEMGEWLKHKETGKYIQITAIDDECIWTNGYSKGGFIREVFESCTFYDGTPFGKLVEE